MFVATKHKSSVAASILLSRQKMCFVATKTILVAGPASDRAVCDGPPGQPQFVQQVANTTSLYAVASAMPTTDPEPSDWNRLETTVDGHATSERSVGLPEKGQVIETSGEGRVGGRVRWERGKGGGGRGKGGVFTREKGQEGGVVYLRDHGLCGNYRHGGMFFSHFNHSLTACFPTAYSPPPPPHPYSHPPPPPRPPAPSPSAFPFVFLLDQFCCSVVPSNGCWTRVRC